MTRISGKIQYNNEKNLSIKTKNRFSKVSKFYIYTYCNPLKLIKPTSRKNSLNGGFLIKENSAFIIWVIICVTINNVPNMQVTNEKYFRVVRCDFFLVNNHGDIKNSNI